MGVAMLVGNEAVPAGVPVLWLHASVNDTVGGVRVFRLSRSDFLHCHACTAWM